MGMYTEFVFACEMRENTPEATLNILKFMSNPQFTSEPIELPNEEFFQCDRWRILFVSDSYYFNGKSHVDFYYDEIAKTHYLSVRSNLKNYNDEIEKFLVWIKPYICVNDDFLGYYRYEENEDPVLIYYSKINAENI